MSGRIDPNELRLPTYTEARHAVNLASIRRAGLPAHPALVDEAAWLLYAWWAAARQHGVDVRSSRPLEALPTAALEAVICVSTLS